MNALLDTPSCGLDLASHELSHEKQQVRTKLVHLKGDIVLFLQLEKHSGQTPCILQEIRDNEIKSNPKH